MFQPGRIEELTIERIDERGAWLAAGGEPVLLPARELPSDAAPGNTLRVFLYCDAAGRPTASCRTPRGEVGDFVLLKVVALGPPGAFLDWGMEKDLLVPHSEQPEKMEVGDSCLVRICLDDRQRVVGTAFIEECLEHEVIDLQEGEEVDLQIWTFTPLGAKVIIDGVYEGLLYKDELRPEMRRGMHLRGRVRRLRDDHKIDVTLLRDPRREIDDAAAVVLAALQQEPTLLLGDKSPPEAIMQRLGLSKKLFKKALGGLYRQGLIEPSAFETRLKQK